MHNQKVWISGLGAISAMGYNVAENFEALQTGKSGIGYAKHLQTIHRETFPVCEIDASNTQLAEQSRMPSNLPRTAYLSAIAVQEALQHAQLDNTVFRNFKVGFLSGNTVGGMDLSENFYAHFLQDQQSGKLQQVVNHECGSITELVANHLGIFSHATTISTACSSSANTILQAARLIKHGILDIAVAGGADALCKFTLNGFHTLMILDTAPCKPFDAQRKGLNLGEGAGYIVLMSDDVRKKLGATTYGYISGYANANDAYHQTASSAEGNGNFYAMRDALQMSKLSPTDIDYINAHGTGTQNNDESEGIAIGRLFGNQIPAVSSTKAFTGHTLGACGGLEAVFACLAMQNNVIFPNLRWENPIEAHQFIPTTSLTQQTVNHVMSNSFGFGGNCTSLIFSKI